MPHAARRGAGRPPRGARATRRLSQRREKRRVTCGGAVTAVIRNGDASIPAIMTLCAIRRASRPRGLCCPHETRGCRSLRRRTLFRTAHRAALRCGRQPAQLLEEENIRIVSHIASIAGDGRGHLPGIHTGKNRSDAQRSARRGDVTLLQAGTRRRRQRRRRGGGKPGPARRGSATRLTAWRAASPAAPSAFPL